MLTGDFLKNICLAKVHSCHFGHQLHKYQMCSVLPVKYVGTSFTLTCKYGLALQKNTTKKWPDFPWQKWSGLKEGIKGIKEKVLDYLLLSSENLYAFQTFQ